MQTPRPFPEVVEIVVEIPRGVRNKYEFDEEAGSYRLDRVAVVGRLLQLRLRFIEGTGP
jgi:inorganic pyrophosphatase